MAAEAGSSGRRNASKRPRRRAGLNRSERAPREPPGGRGRTIPRGAAAGAARLNGAARAVFLKVGATVLGLGLIVAEEADGRGDEGGAADQLAALADDGLVGVAVECTRVEAEAEGLQRQQQVVAAPEQGQGQVMVGGGDGARGVGGGWGLARGDCDLACSSPCRTGSSGLPRAKQEQMSVPPEMEASITWFWSGGLGGDSGGEGVASGLGFGRG